MKSNKLKFILALVSIFSFNDLCLATGVGLLEEHVNNGLSYVKDGVATVTQNFDTDALLRSLGKIAKDIKHLDFDYSTEFNITIPATNQEVVYNWGFAGSGDLFTPLVSVKPSLRTISSNNNFQENFAIELGKALFEDHMHQLGKGVPILNKFLDSKLSAKMIFSIKTILLLKKFNSVGIEKIQADLLRLFIRLAQSEEFASLDGSQTLASYLPPVVVQILEKTSPVLLIFANEVFNVMTDSDSLNKLVEQGQKIASVSGFVFNDKDVADRFFKEWQDYKDSNFVSKLGEAVKNAGYELNSYDEIIEFKSSPDFIKNKLFAFRDFGPIQTAVLPEALKNTVEGISSFPVSLQIDDGDEHWILFVTDKFGVSQTLKLLLSSLVQTFKDYKNARGNYFKANSQEDLKLRKMLDKQQREIAKIEKFLISKQGQESKRRVDEAIREVNMAFVRKSQLSILQAKITKLQKQEKELKQDIKNKTAAVNKEKNEKNSKNIELLKKEVAEIVRLKSKLEKTKKQIEEIQDEQQNFENDTKARVVSLDETIKDLDDLEALAAEKRASGDVVGSSLEDAILTLKEKINQLEGRDDTVLSVDDKLKKRERTANVYFDEAELLEKELIGKQERINSILDIDKKTIANLLFSSKEEQYKLRIASLKEEAEKILSDNKKARDLSLFREMSDSDEGLSAEQKENINEFENAVGYILDGRQCVNTIMSYLQNNKEIREFTNLINSQIPEYQGIRDSLFGKLKFLAQNSTYIDGNKATIDLLIKRVLPEFPVSLRD